MKIRFTVGCDPEFFIKQHGQYKSAVGIIGGSKDHPLKIDNLGSAILEDNVAVEFNTQPATNPAEFRAAIHKVLDHLRGKLTGYEFSQESAAFFPKEELDTPQAQEFGCEPDFNAWLECQNDKPCASDKTLRSAGGHIHVGNVIAKRNPLDVIRSMDLFLGVPSVKLDNGKLRRELYGQAGCFRFNKYGVEYRTLSKFSIFDDALIECAYAGTKRALEFVKKGSVISPEDGFLIQRCINTSNLDDYNTLAKRFAL